jgi:tRNA-specific 2-thiouridylase
VLAALSGGVDSSVAAALLREQGHEVVGVTMRLWGGESDTGCCSVSEVEDARRAAAQLGIDHHVFNFGDEFDTHVVEPYVRDHLEGRTPNPCVECNRHLKFDVLTRRAELLGFDAVATGHHARRVRGVDGTWHVARGADAAKDQSYVLYPLRGEELARVLLPIGHLHKDDVRRLATELGLRTASKPDSQDVCFITRAHGRAAFLSERAELHAGRVLDARGEQVGTVSAVELVTIGQRRGLELAGGSDRRFVVDVDVPSRTVIVGGRDDLLQHELVLERVVAADGGPLSGEVWAQCSAHGEPAPAVVEPHGPCLRLRWRTPQRRVAPGQSVVLYAPRLLDDTARSTEHVVIGGGVVAVSGADGQATLGGVGEQGTGP